jgi:hypothetical protein
LVPAASLQTCERGNACLTCSVFVTDDTHHETLRWQLGETEQLISNATAAFQQRHVRPMPADNVWLVQRHAEHATLTQLLYTMSENPGHAVQGAGWGAAPAGPSRSPSKPSAFAGLGNDRPPRPPQRRADRRREGQIPDQDRCC